MSRPNLDGDVNADKRERFVDALTDYLTTDEVSHSIGLQMGTVGDKRWSRLRACFPLGGYHVDQADKDRARRQVEAWLLDTFGEPESAE